MPALFLPALPALLLSGAIFGFFYAWVCSTMWGLDALPPETAIAAMQAMNESVRNAVFAPAFFGTGPVLLLTAAWAMTRGSGRAAALFALAGAVYLLGAFLPTALVNVPMNRALALVDPLARTQRRSGRPIRRAGRRGTWRARWRRAGRWRCAARL